MVGVISDSPDAFVYGLPFHFRPLSKRMMPITAIAASTESATVKGFILTPPYHNIAPETQDDSYAGTDDKSEQTYTFRLCKGSDDQQGKSHFCHVPKELGRVRVRKKVCEDDPAVRCKSDEDCVGVCNLGFPKGIQVTVGDRFTDPAKLFEVKKPTRLCTPVEKEGVGGELTEIQDPDTHLMCYRVVVVKGVCAEGSPQNAGGACKKEEDCGGTKDETTFCLVQPKHERVAGIHTNNQFGPERLDTIKEEELCLPSVKTLLELGS